MVNVMIQAKFRRICMESSEQTGAYIYPTIFTNRLILARRLFYLAISEYANQSHNFTNLNFCDVTLLFSIFLL